MERINVTKSFLPPIEEYEKCLQEIWGNNQITNGGPLVEKLEDEIRNYLNVPDFQYVVNGTIALQLAISGLELEDCEIITTPFSYVATVNAILWQRCRPVFVDINPETLCINPVEIESKITSHTKAIMPVHVFGNICDIEAISAIAEKHDLKVIYDAAHAFGVNYKNQSVMSCGDVSACSFHATKLFHTIEGGGVFCKNKKTSDRIDLQKRFGHIGENHYLLGINAKASEFHAAMGLVNLSHINDIINDRRRISELYDELLNKTNICYRPQINKDGYNYAYYPVLFANSVLKNKVIKDLNDLNIFPRRYFYPSLNTLPYLDEYEACPISEDVCDRVLCLPLFVDLQEEVVQKICETICRAE